MLESVYEECLCYELIHAGLKIERQKEIPVFYEEVKMKLGYRCDIVIEDKVIVELKSVSELDDLHTAQLLTYLKLTKCKLGLLINFNVVLLKTGYKRIANEL